MSFSLSRVVFAAALVLIPVRSSAAPAEYRVELLDTGQFDAPSEALPAGGFLVDVALISPNGRYVATLVADRLDPEGRRLLARIDRETSTEELIPDLELPVFPYGINDEGAIVVTAPGPDGIHLQTHYWSSSTGSMSFGEGSLPARFLSHGSSEGFPRILNQSGLVLVHVEMNDGQENVLWDPVNDTRTVIGLNSGEGESLSATSLNDLGQVVGTVTFPTSEFNEVDHRAFIWDDAGGLRILDDLGLVSPNTGPFTQFGRVARANAINEAGVIVGETRNEDFDLLGLIWDSEADSPSLLPCQSPDMLLPPMACAVWLLTDSRNFLGGEESDEVIRSHIVWDGAEPFLLRDLIVEGNNSCAIRAMANDGTLAGTCGAPVLVFPIAADGQPPVVSDVAADPNPVPVDSGVRLTAEIDDTGTGGSVITEAHYTIDGGASTVMLAEDGAFDESIEGVVVNSPEFTTPGVYQLCVTGTDLAGNVSAPACTFVAVFDPADGFATGGGWVDVWPGAFIEDPAATGTSNFGFIVRYKKGASIPSGSTEFQFHPGSLNFHSTGYDWLVIENEDAARFTGTGTVNGGPAPSGAPYRFMAWAHDSDPDTFRIRIWWEGAGGEITVFDNGTGALDGGSIVIHGSGG